MAKEKQMARKYVWIAYTVGDDGNTAQVHAVGDKKETLDDIVGMYVEGPVPADMYPVGKTFKLVEETA